MLLYFFIFASEVIHSNHEYKVFYKPNYEGNGNTTKMSTSRWFKIPLL